MAHTVHTVILLKKYYLNLCIPDRVLVFQYKKTFGDYFELFYAALTCLHMMVSACWRLCIVQKAKVLYNTTTMPQGETSGGGKHDINRNMPGFFHNRPWQRSVLCFLTLEHKLLHLNLVERAGANDGAVAGQVDAAARLQRLYLLRTIQTIQVPVSDLAPLCSFCVGFSLSLCIFLCIHICPYFTFDCLTVLMFYVLYGILIIF